MSLSQVRRISSPLFAAIGLALLVSACSSLKGKAKDFMEAGAYDQALTYYQMAIDKDPSDVEARAGLMAARTKYVDTKLIETRMARLAGNNQQAMDLLLDIVVKEKAWGYAPPGQIAFTQEEEVAEGLRFLEAKSAQSIAQDRPLVALYYFRHYRPVFESTPGAYTASFRKAEAKGKLQCGKLAKLREKGRPYFAQFVGRVCTQWGQEQKDIAQVNSEIAKKLFNGVTVKFALAKVEGGLKSELDSAVQEAFRATPWYNASAPKKLELKVDGSFNHQHTEQPETLIHNYTVQEPYTAYEQVKKSRSVPYSDSQMKCFYDAQNKYQCAQDSVTRYRQEEYFETEPRTRYRDVPRTFPYTATHHRQLIEISMDGKLEFPAETQSIGQQEKAERAGYQHNHSRPDIGLKPSDPGLIDSNQWFREQTRKFSEKLRTSASQYWSALYCQPEGGNASLAATGEQVQKCLANPAAGAPAFADQWYQANFGISLSQAKEISI